MKGARGLVPLAENFWAEASRRGMLVDWNPERGHHVWRGGCFNNNRRNARSSYRNNNQPDEQNENLGFRLAGGCGTGQTACLPEFRRGIAGACFSTSGPRSRRGQCASNKNRSWSWARLAARTALFGAAVRGKKGKCVEDLFPQPPRVAVHRVPDPRPHRLIHGCLVDEPRVVVRVKLAKTPPEADHVGPHEACVGWEEPKAEERETVATPIHTGLAGMHHGRAAGSPKRLA
jgi:hypothetical protein